jgi:hypothetical protein
MTNKAKANHKIPVFLIYIYLGLVAVLLSACNGQSDSGITPAADKLTFLFFYTNG